MKGPRVDESMEEIFHLPIKIFLTINFKDTDDTKFHFSALFFHFAASMRINKNIHNYRSSSKYRLHLRR